MLRKGTSVSKPKDVQHVTNLMKTCEGSRMPQNPPWGPRLALLRVQARSSVPLSSRQQGSHAPVGDFACANRCAWCPRSGAHLWNRIHLCPAQPSRSLCDHLQASSAVFKTNILQIFSSKKLWFLAPFYGFSHLTPSIDQTKPPSFFWRFLDNLPAPFPFSSVVTISFS